MTNWLKVLLRWALYVVAVILPLSVAVGVQWQVQIWPIYILMFVAESIIVMPCVRCFGNFERRAGISVSDPDVAMSPAFIGLIIFNGELLFRWHDVRYATGKWQEGVVFLVVAGIVSLIYFARLSRRQPKEAQI